MKHIFTNRRIVSAFGIFVLLAFMNVPVYSQEDWAKPGILIDSKIVFHGPERDWRSLPRALVCDDSGRVFTSCTDGKLVFYNPKSGQIESTGLTIPGINFPIQFMSDYPIVEYFDRANNELIMAVHRMDICSLLILSVWSF